MSDGNSEKRKLSWAERNPKPPRTEERKLQIRKQRLDASHQVRRLAQLRQRLYGDDSLFLELMNEGLQLFKKKATKKDLAAIETANNMDLDMLVVYAQMLGTRVVFEGADKTPLVNIPNARILPRLKKVIRKANEARKLKSFENMAFDVLSITVDAMNGGTILKTTKIQVKSHHLRKRVLSALISVKMGELMELEEEFRMMGIGIVPKKG